MSISTAIIGCSFSEYCYFCCYHTSSHGWPGENRTGIVSKDKTWSALLAKDYPDHKFYNYSKGGRGIDYFQWCLLDAKKRDIDNVIIIKTHPHRSSLMIDNISEGYDNSFKFTPCETNYDNLFKMEFGSEMIWTSTKTKFVPEKTLATKTFLDQYYQIHSGSDIKQSYDDTFFENVTTLYNFKHILNYSFNKQDKDSIWDWFKSRYECKSIDQLAVNGITIATDDDHLTEYGHKILYEKYLKKSIDKILKSL